MRILILLLLLWPAWTCAQTVQPCEDYRSHALAIAEPWEEYSRTFANGAVRVAMTDTIEPALGAMNLLIMSPPYDEVGSRQCRVVSAFGSMGYTAMFFKDLTSEYIPGQGLKFTVPVLNSDGDTHASYMLSVIVNQATGVVTARQAVTSE